MPAISLFLSTLVPRVPVQPFPVTCETCRARLKIRDASVIGEIHGCPRCGAMVHILPPVGWGDDTSLESAPSEPAPPAPAANTPSTPEPVPSPAPSINLGDAWEPNASFNDFNVAETPALPTASAPSIDTHAASPAPPTEYAEPPADIVSEPPVTASRAAALPPTLFERALAQPILLWGGVGAVVLFVSGFSTALWLTSDATPATPAQRNSVASTPILPDDGAPDEGDAAAGNESMLSDEAQPPSIEESSLADVAAPQRPSAPSEHEVARPIAADVDGNVQRSEDRNIAEQRHEDTPAIDVASSLAAHPELPELPPDVPATDSDADGNATAPARIDKTRPGASVANASRSKPVLKFDPLNFDPLALGLSSSAPAPPGSAKISVADDTKIDPLPPPMAETEGLPSDRELFEPAEDPTITVDRGPTPAPDLPAVDVSEQLALPIDSIDMPAVTLADFLNSIAELADVPVTLDPTALQLAGVSPREGIIVRDRNTTLEKLLRDRLKEKRLDFVARDGQIIIVRPGIDERRSVNYELEDLIPIAAADAAPLAELLTQFVAPASWQRAGGEGTVKIDGTKLVIEQSHGVHYQVLIFFERLRTARNLAPRSGYPQALLAIDSPYGKLVEILDGTTTFTFLPWTSLAEVVAHWQEAAGLTILVDWQALAADGLVPSSPVSCSAIERKWDDALTTILAELGLAWVAVDQETIQITTQETAERAAQLEFYAIADAFRDQFSSADALIDSLGTELQEKFPPRVGSAPAQLAVDDPSGRLLVLASPAAHRYLAERLTGIVTSHVTDTNANATRVSAQPLP